MFCICANRKLRFHETIFLRTALDQSCNILARLFTSLRGISLGRTGYVSSRIQFHLNPLGINFSSHGQMKLLKHRSIFYHFHILSKLFRGLDDELYVIEKHPIYENNQIHLLTKHANIKFVFQDILKTSNYSLCQKCPWIC